MGFRTLNLLLALGLRGLPLPECCHQKWGDYGRALQASGLAGANLKLTCICNTGSGPYVSGRNQFNSRRAADLMSLQKDDAFYEQLSRDVCSDRHLEEGSLELTADDLVQAPGIKTRLLKALSKRGVPCGVLQGMFKLRVAVLGTDALQLLPLFPKIRR